MLYFIARYPKSTTREIANAAGITERATHNLIGDLEKDGYIVKEKIGRQNNYLVNTTLPLRGPNSEDATIGDVLKVLLGHKGKRRTTAKPAQAGDNRHEPQ